MLGKEEKFEDGWIWAFSLNFIADDLSLYISKDFKFHHLSIGFPTKIDLIFPPLLFIDLKHILDPLNTYQK